MNLLYTNCNDYNYSTNTKLTVTSDLYCPLNIDTEFYSRALNDDQYSSLPSPTITVQVRGIDNDSIGTIYTHKDCEDIAKHPLMKLPFIGYQYLIDNGCKITFIRPKINNYEYLKSLPKLHFHLYAHFIVADLARVFYGDYRQDILDLIIYAKNGTGKGITQERRTRTYTKSRHKGFHEYCEMNWLVNLNDIDYQVTIGLKDTNGIAGIASYSDLGVLSGIELKYKDSLKQVDKENMRDTYMSNENFENYALGDLYCHDMVLGLNTLFKEVQKEIGINDDDLIPIRLTIGSSIARLVESIIIKQLNNKELFKPLTNLANSDELRKVKNSLAILSKVDGGRCFNNRPLDIVITKKKYDNFEDFINELNSLCDIDINGAYGRGLSIQDYPLGSPKHFSHGLNTNNKYLTLREFLKIHGDELVDGLWTMRVSTIKRLKYPQDFISSWIIDVNKIDRLSNEDKDDLSVDYPKEGIVKYFSNEIKLGTITSDILDLIMNICSRDQKNELLDNLLVINAMWYDKNLEVDNIEDLETSTINYNDLDESSYDGEVRKDIVKKNYKWYRLNLGKLLINKLLHLRSLYVKKSKENEFYKLCINTTYGVLVSKWFSISNTVVGNNITARCRMMAWYLEKGLNGFQTITDGCVFELDKIVYPVKGKRLTANNLVRGYSNTSDERKWFLDKLKINNYRKLILENSEHYIREDLFLDNLKNTFKEVTNSDDNNIKANFSEMVNFYKNCKKEDLLKLENYPIKFRKIVYLLNELAKRNIPFPEKNYYNIELDILNHLRNIFPNVKILHQDIINSEGIEQKGYYTLEIKCFSGKGVFHGNANYKLSNNSKIIINENKSEIINFDDTYKMRGYKSNRCYLINDESIEESEIEIDEIILGNLILFNESFEKTSVNLPKDFLDNLENNYEYLERSKPFIQESIIKCKDYKQKYNSFYRHNNLCIGNTEVRSRLLTELILGQFLFIDINQFKQWGDKHKKTKDKYGQGYESVFSDDLRLKYKEMINKIDDSIQKEKMIRITAKKHPYFDELRNIRQGVLNTSNEELS